MYVRSGSVNKRCVIARLRHNRCRCIVEEFSGFYFFQAEDGIRDRNVTGVQTCALPIFHMERAGGARKSSGKDEAPDRPAGTFHMNGVVNTRQVSRYRRASIRSDRSEERRVGKECRCMFVADQ